MYIVLKYLTALLSAVVLLGAPALAELTACEEHSFELPMDKVLAEAGVLDNFFNREGSVRFEARRLLAKARKAVASATPADGFCPARCRPAKQPIVLFKSVPNRLRDKKDESCHTLLDQTKERPISYQDLSFDSVDSLCDWIGDFSQGEGTEGEDLYARCAGACSPQYSYRISNIERDALSVDAEVVCGHARDKNDDKYQLAYSFHWSCEPAPKVETVDTPAKAKIPLASQHPG